MSLLPRQLGTLMCHSIWNPHGVPLVDCRLLIGLLTHDSLIWLLGCSTRCTWKTVSQLIALLLLHLLLVWIGISRSIAVNVLWRVYWMHLCVANKLIEAGRTLIILRLVDVFVAKGLCLMAHRETMTMIEWVLLGSTYRCITCGTINVEISSTLLLTFCLAC